MSQTRFLPIFPLRLVVFPGESLNLHIFEPRYKQLIHDCLKEGITFGIPAYMDDKLMDFGTEIRLIAIEKKYPEGELDIRTEGIGIFKIHNFFAKAPGKLYGGADVEDLTYTTEGDFLKNESILEKAAELFRLLNIRKEIPANDDQFLTYKIAHYVGFTIEQEYEFLCIEREVDRQDYMLHHLDSTLPVVREMENLRQRALLNGHFKSIVPPAF